MSQEIISESEDITTVVNDQLAFVSLALGYHKIRARNDKVMLVIKLDAEIRQYIRIGGALVFTKTVVIVTVD